MKTLKAASLGKGTCWYITELINLFYAKVKVNNCKGKQLYSSLVVYIVYQVTWPIGKYSTLIKDIQISLRILVFLKSDIKTVVEKQYLFA